MSGSDDSYFTDQDSDENENVEALESFSLLAHDIRMEILLEMIEHRHPTSGAVSYSELMDAVGVEDSGKFNYHLNKLRGRYVKKVEDGYVPMAPVTDLYRAVLANRPMSEPDRTEFELDSNCPYCDSQSIEGTYPGEFFQAHCTDCDSVFSVYPLPKNGLEDRDDEEVFRAVQNRARHHVGLARDGQCPFCVGRTNTEVLLNRLEDDDSHDVEITCDTCSFFIQTSLIFPLLTDTRVTASLGEAGIFLEEIDLWEMIRTDKTVKSENPIRIALEVLPDDDGPTITVDSDLNVISISPDLGRNETS